MSQVTDLQKRIMELIFWSSIGLMCYAYIGYPLVMRLLAVFISRPVLKDEIEATVSFIVTAYNEEAQIAKKIENTLAQAYPVEKLEIIVASDCSTDGTDAIVRSYESRGVRLVRQDERKGKEAVQKQAIDASSGEILVFSDVATILAGDGVSAIVKNFADPSVGCVSSVDRFVDAQGRVSGEGLYVRYEMALRALESRVNTLVGLSGSFFAARRAVCKEWAEDLQSDFNTLLHAVKLGLRGVADPESIGYYRNLADERNEFERKVRTVLRGICVLMSSLPMLNPFQYGLFAWQLLSHKLCRWLVPFAMMLAFVSNVPLALQARGYMAALVIQGGLYIIALGGIWRGSSGQHVLKIPAFLVMVNWSIVSAWYRFLKGERMMRWESSRR